MVTAFATRLFSVLRFESVIHEFDPYFNYRTTRYLTEQGFYNFHNWFDDRAWYPLGRIIGGTIYPGKYPFFKFQMLKLTAQFPKISRILKIHSFS